MLESLVSDVGQIIEASPWLAPLAVFVAGVLTAAAPCVLATIPLMMAFVAGRRDGETRPMKAFGLSLVFVLGLSITFVALGVFAALAGKLYGEVSLVWNWIVAVVCLVMGLHLAGLLKFTIPTPAALRPQARGALGALLLGLLFGLVSAPCAAPVLVVLLTYLAGSNASVSYGALLLMMYALGHSVLVLVAGTSMGAAKSLLESKRFTRATEILRRASGVAIVGVGLFFALRALL